MSSQTTSSPNTQPQRIAIRIPSWAAYGREIYRGITSYILEHRVHWELNTDLVTDDEIRPASNQGDWDVDGAIFFRYTEQEAEAFRELGRPIISISRESTAEDVIRVHANNRAIGRLAAEHLVAIGAPNLACLGDSKRLYWQDRVDGFVEAAGEMNRTVKIIDFEASSLPRADRWRAIYEAMKVGLSSLKKPVGLFVRDDIAARGVTDVARDLGINIPKDLAVIGVGDDDVLCSVASPALSTIEIPARQIGYLAARCLDEQLRGEASERMVYELGGSRVIRRDSTSLLMVEDELVSQAWELIRARAPREKLVVARICKELGISTTTLIKRFRDQLGRSPKEVIDRTRFEEAVKLIEGTQWAIKRIAYELDFRSPEEFDRFFKRQSGQTPGNFRSQVRQDV